MAIHITRLTIIVIIMYSVVMSTELITELAASPLESMGHNSGVRRSTQEAALECTFQLRPMHDEAGYAWSGSVRGSAPPLLHERTQRESGLPAHPLGHRSHASKNPIVRDSDKGPQANRQGPGFPSPPPLTPTGAARPRHERLDSAEHTLRLSRSIGWFDPTGLELPRSRNPAASLLILTRWLTIVDHLASSNPRHDVGVVPRNFRRQG